MKKLFLVCLIVLSGCEPIPPKYAWQNRCNNSCLRKVGEKQMAMINEQDSCLTLQSMLGGSQGSINGTEDLWDAAFQDKIDFMECFRQGRKRTEPYKPAFDWQNRCDENCEKNLGKKRLAEIDKFTCEYIDIPKAKNPKLWDDYKDFELEYDEEAKAYLDMADRLKCR